MASLCIIVTMRCTASCAHCASESGPDRQEETEEAAAMRAIEAAARAGYTDVSFNGGEPTLRLAVLKRLVTHATRLGLQTGMISNGHWATTEDQAVDLLGALKTLGLGRLCLSTDVWHASHVPLDNVIRAARVARAIQLSCHLSVCVDVTRPSRPSCDLLDRLARDAPVPIRTVPVAPVGRAVSLLSRAVYRRVVAGAQCVAGREVFLFPTGGLFACCFSGFWSRSGAGALLLGNARDEDENHLASALRRGALSRSLRREGGPPAVLAALGERRDLIDASVRAANAGCRRWDCWDCMELIGKIEALRGRSAPPLPQPHLTQRLAQSPHTR